MRIGVSPDMVGFAEAAGLAEVAYGPDIRELFAAQRDQWTCLLDNFWKIRDLIRFSRDATEPITRCWGAMSAALTSLTDGADLLLTNVVFETLAANVAEFHHIPLATLHYFPKRPTDQILPFLPSPVGRTALAGYEWLSWRVTRKVEDAQRRELGLPKSGGPAFRRIIDRGSLEIQAYDEVFFPGLATEWARWIDQRPLVGALTMELPTDADEEIASWIAAGTPPIYVGFGSSPLESPADDLAMIGAACAQLGERALVCSGWAGFRSFPQGLPHIEHVKVVGAVNHAATFPACRAVVHWDAHIDPLEQSRSGIVLGNSGQTTRGGHRSAFFGHHAGISGRRPAHHPRAVMWRPSPRARHPDDHTRRQPHRYRRSAGKFRPPGARSPAFIARREGCERPPWDREKSWARSGVAIAR